MPKNIILTGFMGTGKSSLGRELSLNLGYPVIDTDEMIVEKEGRSIPEIFEKEGEEKFRELESGILQGLTETTQHIISTGGGIVERAENRALLPQLGFVACLVASPEEILARTARNHNRPLLNTKDPEQTVRTLLARRYPLYKECAHLEIETDSLSFDEIATGIIESARYHFSSQE